MQAILTTVWGESVDNAESADSLYNSAMSEDGVDVDKLETALRAAQQPIIVSGLDALFRRNTSGFNPIKRFVGALTQVEERGVGPVTCRINAIAYALLKGAKNFDLLLPEDRDTNGPFREVLPSWKHQIAALERFERDGDDRLDPWLRERYLESRPVMARASARDEQRSLAALLLSGPSTREEITQDLGLSYDLSQRVMAPFVSSGIVEASKQEGCYTIAHRALPLVLFLLRETIGIDPLTILCD
jgi:hypothetical protein